MAQVSEWLSLINSLLGHWTLRSKVGTSSWNPSLWKTTIFLSYIAKAMAHDDLLQQWSHGIDIFSLNIQALTQEVLTKGLNKNNQHLVDAIFHEAHPYLNHLWSSLPMHIYTSPGLKELSHTTKLCQYSYQHSHVSIGPDRDQLRSWPIADISCSQLYTILSGILLIYDATLILNSLTAERLECNLDDSFSISLIAGWCYLLQNCPEMNVLDLTDDKSTLVQLMAWCRQATSHYLT